MRSTRLSLGSQLLQRKRASFDRSLFLLFEPFQCFLNKHVDVHFLGHVGWSKLFQPIEQAVVDADSGCFSDCHWCFFEAEQL